MPNGEEQHVTRVQVDQIKTRVLILGGNLHQQHILISLERENLTKMFSDKGVLLLAHSAIVVELRARGIDPGCPDRSTVIEPDGQ